VESGLKTGLLVINVMALKGRLASQGGESFVFFKEIVFKKVLKSFRRVLKSKNSLTVRFLKKLKKLKKFKKFKKLKKLGLGVSG
jgi:hypothetical protein